MHSLGRARIQKP